MHKLRRCSVVGVTFMALALAAGGHCTAAAQTWSLVVSICADGDLRPLGERYARTVAEAAESSEWSLALQLDNGDNRPIRRLLRDGREHPVAAWDADTPANLADAATLADFFAWARSEVPAERYAIVVFGHGTSASGRGWDGVAAGAWPALGIDRSAGGDPLEPRELASAVERGLGGRAEIVVLDCCYGASLEVAWALRDAARLVIASPGRLRSTGLAWQAMLQAERPATAEQLALKWAGSAAQPLTIVRCDGLEMLRADLSRMCRSLQAQMPQTASALTAARSQCPTWGCEREMCDLRALCEGIIARSNDDIAAAAAQTLVDLDRCVVKAAGAGEGAVTVPFAAGLGTRWPAMRRDGFTESSGWGEMTRAYHDRMRDLLRRTHHDRRYDGAAT